MKLEQHQLEIQRNKTAWEQKPLLRAIYQRFYERIARQIAGTEGQILELGSGIGNLKEAMPQAICSDLFPHPWLDLQCSAYELPFQSSSLAAVVMFDVFHHLEHPAAALTEISRLLIPGGKIVIFEPCVSAFSFFVYGWLHPEPVALHKPIDLTPERPLDHRYYAAQGNATRLFLHSNKGNWIPSTLRLMHKFIFADWAYLLSGGFSRPAFYPQALFPFLSRMDEALSRFPRLFGSRCLIVLENFNP